MDVEDRVVVASDFTSVPPTCFNSFHVTEKPQRASAAWDTVEFFQLLWRWKKPQGPTEGRPWGRGSQRQRTASAGDLGPRPTRFATARGPTRARRDRWLAHAPRSLRPMSLQRLKPIHRFMPQARPQTLNEL